MSGCASESPKSRISRRHLTTILVTGGAGFVGSHACKALARAGYLPVTFDNLEHGHERAVKWDRWSAAICAITTTSNAPSQSIGRDALRSLCLCRRIDARPGYDNNVGGAAKLLQACAAFVCSNVVFSSSRATYGVPERLNPSCRVIRTWQEPIRLASRAAWVVADRRRTIFWPRYKDCGWSRSSAQGRGRTDPASQAAERLAPRAFGSTAGSGRGAIAIDLTPLSIRRRLRHLSIAASRRSSTSKSAVNRSTVTISLCVCS